MSGSYVRPRVLVVSAIGALAMLGLVPGAQAAPMDVTFTVVNQRGINQFSYIKLAGSFGFANQTDGNGQFSASVASCGGSLGPCISPGDHVSFSRDEVQTGVCAAPEDPAGGLNYVVTSSPSQTVTLPNTTGDSNHSSLTNTESWIVGRLNQDRAAHSPPLAPLHVSSTLTQAAYAIAHDRALAAGHPYPPPYCFVNLSDWGWPAPGFLHEDSPYAAPEATLAHWDGSAGDAESLNLASHGVFNPANTAVGVADGGGTWIIEYNDCSYIAPAFVSRCGMTGDTGNPNAYTPPLPGAGTTGGGNTGVSTTGGQAGAGSGVTTLSIGGGSVSLGGSSSASAITATSSAVAVTLSCTGASGKTCAGQVSVFVRERTRGGNVLAMLTRSRGSKTRAVKVLVGLATYTIAAGQIKTVTVSLNGLGRSLLKRFHRLKVAVNVSVSTKSGLSQVASRTVTIKAALTRNRHKRH
ncbi:MAG TPA: hypothetical protein VGW98_03160 [Solirubrobacteraceae bacterium]|nr:hypothetical protein [Solirubrobacteraceae bacterium]